MLKLALALTTALVATPALAATVTSQAKLVDQSPLTPGIIVNKAVTTPQAKKGTVLFDCGSTQAPFVYGVGSADACPAPPEVINGASSKSDTLYGRNGVLALDKCRPARVVNPYRVVETYSSSVYKNVTCSGLVGEGIKRDGIRLKGTLENVTIENFKFTHEDTPSVPPHLPEGIAISAGKNITIRNGESSGFRMTMTGYVNGDAYASERAVNGLRFENTIGRNSSDGCYDLKSKNTVMVNTFAYNCSRNYRFWGTGVAEKITSEDARLWHVGLYSASMKWQIKKIVVRSTTKAAIFHSESKGPGTSFIVDPGACDIIAPLGTKLFEGSKTETFVIPSDCVIRQK